MKYLRIACKTVFRNVEIPKTIKMKINGTKNSMLSVTAKTERRREGKKFRQYLAAIAATIGPFAVGTVLAWTSPVEPLLTNITAHEPGPYLTQDQASWAGSLIAIGAVFGSLPASWGADFVGRKTAIATLAIPFLISWVIIIVAKSVELLYLARLIAGGVIGAVTATVPMYIGEIAETSVRGELGSYIQLMVTMGILYVYVIGSFVDYVMLNILCAIVPIVYLIFFMVVAPESPTFLMRKNRRKEAEQSLLVLRGDQYDIYSELDEIQEQIDEERKRQQSFKDLFSSKAVIKATIAVMGLLSFLSFSGINVVIFYAKKIFEAGGTKVPADLATIIIGSVQVIMTYASGLLVDRAGRRVLLLISDSIMALCMLALGTYFYAKENKYDVENFGWVPLVSLSVYISVFSLGFGPIPGIMMGELFSPEAKGVALGVVCILASLLEFVVVKGFQNLVDWVNFGITFWIFAGFCVIGFLFVYFLVPETKNKSLQEIQDELSGIKKKKKKGKKVNGAQVTKTPIVVNQQLTTTNATNAV
ncbi:facilitated trehalose transporter Tret1-like isoform X2 [Planococcus citri]|uniref:facilitated trehalose transporter Tret1-like isoform X2 n=1 Tax=Planococcus citri TaxID=170843 RepID=UPI0031F7B747